MPFYLIEKYDIYDVIFDQDRIQDETLEKDAPSRRLMGQRRLD